MKKLLNIKILVVTLIVCFAVVIYARINSEKDNFSQAKDFPKGALVYVQFSDLNKVFYMWNDSKLKENYLKSRNYKEFSKRHLALKIAERWKEFNSAFSMPFDLESLSETKAAIAFYDIGKLDFVFVAPMSKEKILASYFFLNKGGFEENKLQNGDVFYSKEIEVDRGQEKQKLLFMNYKGRLIFATNEAKFFRTFAILNGESKNHSLADEVEFKKLTEQSESHLATVWVNQAKLNNDWYFKRYWLMNNFEDLKKIRAGIFDFEIQENKIIEHRLFLQTAEKKGKTRNLSAEKIRSIQSKIPKDIAFYKIQSADKKDSISKLLRKTLLDNYSIPQTSNNASNDFYFYDNFGFEHTDYSHLGNDFDSQIDDEEDAGIADDSDINSFRVQVENKFLSELQNTLSKSKPDSLIYLINPKKLANPLFLKTQKALIFSVQNNNRLNKNALEKSISKLLQNRLTSSNSSVDFNWKTIEKDGIVCRKISTPFLDWNFFYAIRKSDIIFANDKEFLVRILTMENRKAEKTGEKKLSEFTFINFNQREKVFDDVMKMIAKNNHYSEISNDFFVDNVGSLLDVSSEIETVEIERSEMKVFLQEKTIYSLREK